MTLKENCVGELKNHTLAQRQQNVVADLIGHPVDQTKTTFENKIIALWYSVRQRVALGFSRSLVSEQNVLLDQSPLL